MDLVNQVTAGEAAGVKDPVTEVVHLSDVNLEALLEDMETECSPETLLGVSNGSPEKSSAKNYLWCAKKSPSSLQYQSTKTNSKINKSSFSNSDSDIDSTCGMVNIHNDSRFNMCENPSDLWFGLKMSDGTPVVINSRNKNFRNPGGPRKHSYRNKQRPRSFRGPIDYSSGFLSISKYIGVSTSRSEVYYSGSSVRRQNLDLSPNIRPSHRSKGFLRRPNGPRYNSKLRQDYLPNNNSFLDNLN
uniref:Uncharacterized protein n=1 Tax=Theileria annulata TaxID=5874 RepID=A0A3B0NJY4_THEAN